MTGYDDSPDYGGPDPTWRGVLNGALIFLLAALLVAYARAAVFVGTVEKVIDGDTLWLCDPTACHKIRLCGIDAPEQGDAGYAESGEALRSLVAGMNVRCVQVGDGTPCDGRSKPMNRDRIVAQCFAGEADIAGALVALRAACDWTKFTRGHYSKCAGTAACPPGHRQP
jgi:endonuclease YncB( thermonuclease family)